MSDCQHVYCKVGEVPYPWNCERCHLCGQPRQWHREGSK